MLPQGITISYACGVSLHPPRATSSVKNPDKVSRENRLSPARERNSHGTPCNAFSAASLAMHPGRGSLKATATFISAFCTVIVAKTWLPPHRRRRLSVDQNTVFHVTRAII